jgi:hypothetical protein
LLLQPEKGDLSEGSIERLLRASAISRLIKKSGCEAK